MTKKIAVLQIDSKRDDPQANLEKVERMIKTIDDKSVRMAVFCEAGISGVGNDYKKIADPIPGRVSEGLESIAKKYDIWICGGTIEMVGDKAANSLLLVSPEKGLIANYRKIHMFRSERETMISGDEPMVVDTELGKVGLTICYDFIFPELTRGLALNGAEIVINSTFWAADDFSGPAGWGPEQALSLARIRALENNVFVAMACRTGEEPSFLLGKSRAFGHSSIANPVGKTIASAGLGEMVITAEIDLELRKTWSSYATYLEDRRPEIYKKIMDI